MPLDLAAGKTMATKRLPFLATGPYHFDATTLRLKLGQTGMQSSRRSFLKRGLIVALGAPTTVAGVASASAFGNAPSWQGYFSGIDRGGIVINTTTRRLMCWTPADKAYREFPVGVARSEDLLKTGTTSIVAKKAAPSWSPTPAMRRRNPDLPSYVAPGPENPLGPYALYLGWQYYAIHGTNDPITVGRPTTSGCFRLFDSHISWLYASIPIGTPVVVL